MEPDVTRPAGGRAGSAGMNQRTSMAGVGLYEQERSRAGLEHEDLGMMRNH
jgi:hypothetical protein